MQRRVKHTEIKWVKRAVQIKNMKGMLIKAKGDDYSPAEKYTKVIGKAEEMDGPNKDIGKKGEEKVKREKVQ